MLGWLFRRRHPLPDVSYLAFGIGNPGRRYRDTRHNIGSTVIERLCTEGGVIYRCKEQKARLCFALFDGVVACCAQPQTYVNRCGSSFGPLRGKLKCPEERAIVIVDDFNIPLGSIRFRRGGSDGGHNGLKSIIAEAGTAFPRLRIGIGPLPRDMSIIDFVLGKFTETESHTAQESIGRGAEAIRYFFKNGLDAAMNRFNT